MMQNGLCKFKSFCFSWKNIFKAFFTRFHSSIIVARLFFFSPVEFTNNYIWFAAIFMPVNERASVCREHVNSSALVVNFKTFFVVSTLMLKRQQEC
jgi:hypothetical protein